MKEANIVAMAKRMIELYYQGERFLKSKYYTEGMVLIAPDISGRIDVVLRHDDYEICLNQGDAICITGNYGLFYTGRDGRRMSSSCQYSVLFQEQNDIIRLAALHISEQQGKTLCLTDVFENTYFLPETDILYLESGHNRTLWHTGREVIEVTGYLLNAEEELSESFVRIHKSFIVNSLHVEKIARCYVELSNGEELQIPVKRYRDVKEKLVKSRVELMKDL